VDRDAIVRRFDQRPGYELVAVQEVALPVLLLTVSALVIQTQEIPAIQQFVLRSVDQGLDDPAEVAGFLGLEPVVARAVIVELLMRDELYVGAPSTADRRQRLRIGPKGRAALEDFRAAVPTEVTLPIYMDGLTGSLSVESHLHIIRPVEADRRGLTEVPPASRKRIEIEDISLAHLVHAFEKSGGKSLASQSLLGLLAVQRRERWFWEDSLALGFRSNDGRSVQVGFALNGTLSPEHEEAYAMAFGDRPVGLLAELRSSVDEPTPLADIPGLSEEVDQAAAALRAQLRNEEAERERLVAEVASGSPADDTTRRMLAEQEQKVEELEAQLSSISVRSVAMSEHPKLLDRALLESEKRLLIISPWVTTAVVGGLFVQRVEAALKRGVEVYIGYGVKERFARLDKDSQVRALQKLQPLTTRYKQFHLVRLGDTHSKVLVCDDRFVVTTSFNWLSFAGDPDRTFRDERGIYTTSQKVIEAEFEHHRERMEEALLEGQGDKQ